MIEAKKLSKRFGDTLAVDQLDFTVEQGEILGFLGPNGAGKTTTMRILTGYFPPSQGTAVIAGHDVLAQPMAARASLGYLPENVPLYQDMRLGEYLRFVAGAKGMARAQAKKEAQRVMEATGITQRRGQLIKQFSKGYRQRAGLAQALLGDPPVLILDEPTIGLDPRQIVEIRNLIKDFAGNKTVVLSSHILPEVAATCTRILIIDQGKVRAQGPPEILTGGGGTLRLACRGPEEKAVSVLEQTPGVEKLTPAGPGAEPGVLAFNLETTGGRETQALLAKAVVQAGLDLLELAPVRATLEEVFVNLTTSEPGQKEALS